ncbi:MAG: redoxin domain-containing protein [Verrucomicrobiales bacterium]
MSFRTLILCLLPLSAGLADHTDDSPLKAGHSVQGEGFSEGPRQKADLLPGVAGICSFPVTTKSADAQSFFNQGVAQLHGFWFLEAERSFRQVLAIDPDCTMAFWGISMANVENTERARQIIGDGMKAKLDHLNPKERAWLQSLSDFYEKKKGGDDEKNRLRNLVRDWEQIVSDHPDDLEAKAFLVGRIWRNAHHQDLKINSHLAVDSLAKDVLAKAPDHPGIHHYRIHLWNNEKDERALDSAALLGPSAPGIAHNWHMPGHTYSALKRYADAAWQQEASARVDHAHMIRYHLMPDEIHNYAHNNGWLVEDWGYIGRARDAVTLAKNLIELPRIPRSKAGVNTANQDWSKDGSAWAEGRRRLLHALLEFELWDEVLKLEQTPYFESAGDAEEDLRIARLIALANLETGRQLEGLRKIVALFEKEHAWQKERDDSTATAEKKARDEKKSASDVEAAALSVRKPFDEKLKRLREKIAELLLVQKLTSGEVDAAKERLAAVKGVPDGRLARYFARAGDQNKAIELSKNASEAAPGQFAPLANYASILLGAGKEAEAKTEFDKLSRLAQLADPDLPALKRLSPLAQNGWQKPGPPGSDLGKRPPLDQLGPPHWHPPAAPSWQLTGIAGDRHQATDYAGKSYILLFFLGKSCAHCMEQLNVFAPKAREYSDAGLQLIAVSTDNLEGLQKTFDKAGNPFPFSLVSSADLAAFKAFRAYDNFEARPLHSTVLIDGQGRIRWQHISFNPFMKPDFLLEETRRLLKFPSDPSPVAVK